MSKSDITYRSFCRKDKSLRDYQQNAKENIFSAWDEVDNVMFQMPTGTGKTRLFTSMIGDIKAWGVVNSVEKRILIVAHRIELIEQISDNLKRYRIPHGIIAGGRERDLRQQIQVASIQTITHHSNANAINGLKVDFIIIDEAHHSVANSYNKLWNLFKNAKKLGVTATPWRMNNRGYTQLYDKLILSSPIDDFINKGWLATYSYYSIKEDDPIKKRIESISEFDVEGDYKVSALEREIDTLKIRARLLDCYLKYAKGKKGIIYSISHKHSNHIIEVFRSADIRIVCIDSQTPKEERRLLVQRFKNGEIDIIVNVDIFSEGFDCPDIEFIQLARPTRSLVKYLQQVGRGLRPTESKTKCIILDNVGLYSLFGLPNANRDWYSSFIGEMPKKPTIQNIERPIYADSTVIERNYEEGSEELCLIEDFDHIPSVKSVWEERDDELLSVLYLEKKCSLEVLASVFQKNIDEIEARVRLLHVEK
jgi:superfamily II DNA or RNA helicase